ncbi:MAG: Gfo/Idh/MocA family oxidoreductase [Planctomycetota bacterium]
MQSDHIGVVVLGAGWAGRHHIKSWLVTPGTQVLGVYDINPAAAQAAVDLAGGGTVYRSLEAAVAEPRAQVVDICTPNMLHRPGALAAFAAGKHVLCEKPLAATTADIRAMIAARDQAGRLLMTCQHMRFEERTQLLRNMLAGGRLGEVYYGRATWLRRRGAPVGPGFLRKDLAGFGPGMDIGVHVLDLAMHLMGQPQPVSVTGVAGAKLAHRPDVCNQWGCFRSEDFQVEDFAAGFVRFANGAGLAIEVSWLMNMPETEWIGLTLHGTAGGVRWPDLKLAHVQNNVLVDTQAVGPPENHGHQHALAAFVDAIRRGGPSPVPAEESLAVVGVLAALYESAGSGREVQLD